MKTFKKLDFTKKGIELITKKEKIGFISRFDKKFKAPKKLKIEGLGLFTLKTSFIHKLTGKRFIYESSLFEENNQHSTRLIFW